MDSLPKSSKRKAVDLGSKKLPKRIYPLLRDFKPHDATLNGFPCHSVILARSATIRNMVTDTTDIFSNDDTTNNTNANITTLEVDFPREQVNDVLELLYDNAPVLTLTHYNILAFFDLLSEDVVKAIIMASDEKLLCNFCQNNPSVVLPFTNENNFVLQLVALKHEDFMQRANCIMIKMMKGDLDNRSVILIADVLVVRILLNNGINSKLNYEYFPWYMTARSFISFPKGLHDTIFKILPNLGCDFSHLSSKYIGNFNYTKRIVGFVSKFTNIDFSKLDEVDEID